MLDQIKNNLLAKVEMNDKLPWCKSTMNKLWSRWFQHAMFNYIGAVLINLERMQTKSVEWLSFMSLQYLRSYQDRRWVPTSDSAHSWYLYSAAPVGNKVTDTMTQYPTQSQ